MIKPDSKLRVWWLPQVGVSKTFYVPVKDPEEAEEIMLPLEDLNILMWKKTSGSTGILTMEIDSMKI